MSATELHYRFEFPRAKSFHRWQVALRAVPTLPLNDQGGLAKLFPGLLRLLAENMDLLRTSISLMESYMLLAGEELMQVRSCSHMGALDLG